MPHGPCQAQRRDCLHFLKLDPLPPPQHSRDPADQFMAGNRRVFLGERVAAGNNKRLPVHVDRTNDAMGAKTPVAREENDVTWMRTRGWLPQNQKSVTWEDRREHARALRDKPKFAEGIQDLGRKGQFYRGPAFCGRRHVPRSHHLRNSSY